MTTKNVVVLAAAAVILGGTAVWLKSGSAHGAPRLNGQRVMDDFDLSQVAKVEIGDKVTLSGGDGGWTISSWQDYPADHAKIVENLMKLRELKVGQVARGRELASPTEVCLRDASGREIASVTLGERHARWGFGRYASFRGETVLVSDSLDAFGDDPKRWCETKIVDDPWISFTELADPGLTEAELGFATGVVAKVTVAGDTNRTVTVGNAAKSGNGRYLKLDGAKWTFIVPEYSVQKLLPKPEPEKKPEPAVEPELPPEPVQSPSKDAAE